MIFPIKAVHSAIYKGAQLFTFDAPLLELNHHHQLNKFELSAPMSAASTTSATKLSQYETYLLGKLLVQRNMPNITMDEESFSKLEMLLAKEKVRGFFFFSVQIFLKKKHKQLQKYLRIILVALWNFHTNHMNISNLLIQFNVLILMNILIMYINLGNRILRYLKLI